MEPKKDGTYHHGDLRRALVEAAMDNVSRRGPQRFSLRAVAKQLNVSHAAAYRHFRNKESLLCAVSVEGFRRLAASLEEAASEASDIGDAIVAFGLAYVHFGLENAGLYQAMFSEVTQRHDDSRNTANQVLAVSADLLARAQRIGRVRPGDPFEQARAAWSMVHGLVDLNLRLQFGERSDHEVLQQASVLLEAFLHGLMFPQD